MGVLAAFVLPHPPIVLPEIGHGEEMKIQSTTEGFETIAKMIADLKPSTIVIVSPHAVMLRNSFYVCDNPRQRGDFSHFIAPDIRFEVETDTIFVKRLIQNCEHVERLDIDAGILDHGVMVPLYFIRKQWSEFKLVRLGISHADFTDHVDLGKAIRKTAEDLDENIVFIASGDLSHRLKKDGPYGFDADGPKFDTAIVDILSQGNFTELRKIDPGLCENAGECGFRSLVVLSGVLDGVKVEAKLHSYEGTFGVGYATASFLPITFDPYVRLARETIEAFVKHNEILPVEPDVPIELTKRRAGVFVSLHRQGRLRGCIGTIQPTTASVADEIIHNAIQSCAHDPRFYPVRPEELSDLEISVDILSDPQPVSEHRFLDPKRFGVIVSHGNRKGLLLPDLEGVDTVAQQLSIALRKAGIVDDENYTISRFEVIRHHD